MLPWCDLRGQRISMDAVDILGATSQLEISLGEGLLGNALPLQMGCAGTGFKECNPAYKL